MTTTIRPATVADAEPIRRLVRLAFEPWTARIGMEPRPMSADYAAVVDRGHGWVAEDDGRPVAVAVLEPADDHLVVDVVAVDPAAQGRGLGSELLRFAEDRARELGLAQVRLCTNARMTENLIWYPRRGYRETHRDEVRVYYAKTVS